MVNHWATWWREQMTNSTARPVEPSVLALAERQLGLISDRQLDELGIDRRRWVRAVANQQWLDLSGRVWLRSGAPCSGLTCSRAVVLHCGAGSAVSHHSAAALWGIPGFRLWPLQVSVPRTSWGGTDRIELSLPRNFVDDQRAIDHRVLVHRPTAWPDRATGMIDGVDVVRPALLLLQLAPVVAPKRLQRILDHLWSRGLLSGPSVAAELAPMLGRGRAGVVAIRTMLDRCGPGYVPPESNLEARLIDLIDAAGIPRPLRQKDLGDNVRWLGRVDLYWPQWLLVVEVDSDRYHGALSDREDDAKRQRALEAAGYTVVRVTEFELWHRRDQVVDRLRSAVAAARARVAA